MAKRVKRRQPDAYNFKSQFRAELGTLITYQAPAALEVARGVGYLTGKHPYSMSRNADAHRRAYTDIRSYMAEHIKGFSGDLPIWAYCQRPEPNPHSYHAGLGHCEIEFAWDLDRTLLFDQTLFEAYYYFGQFRTMPKREILDAMFLAENRFEGVMISLGQPTALVVVDRVPVTAIHAVLPNEEVRRRNGFARLPTPAELAMKPFSL
jgi:hypothetical protein